ncbi:MAG: hypothetical protein WA755_12275 [Candidatus Acidiferrales bacterium]
MSSGSNSRLCTRRLLVACLALLALLFITAESSLTHDHDDASSATCPVCHMAQQAPVQTAVAVELPTLVAVAWREPRELIAPELEQTPADNPSRAPPSHSL